MTIENKNNNNDNDIISSDDESDLDAYEDWDKTLNPMNIINANELDDDFGVNIRSKEDMEEDDLFAMDEADDNVQFMSVKPYLGSLVAPTNAPNNNSNLPDEKLDLEWVYGYRAYDSRSNLVYNSMGEVVYPAAAVLVCYNPNTHTQKHYRGHNDDIICLAQHPKNPNIVATGQVATIVNRRATLPHICITDTVTGEEWKIPNAGKRAIRSLGFSACGKYIASVGSDNNFSVTVWDWQTSKKLAEEKGDTNKIFHLRWNHKGDTNEFVTVGKRHVFFWNFQNGKLKKRRGRLGKFDDSTFASIAFSDKGFACIGAQNGKMYAFVDGAARKVFPIHKGTIYTLDYTPGGLITGGKDGKVNVLNSKVKPINTLQFPGQVRSVGVNQNTLMVGLHTGEVYRINNFTNCTNIGQPVVKGHYDGELWAITWSPDGKTFASVGEDNMICIWDKNTHKILCSTELENASKKLSRRKKKGKRQKAPGRAKASSTTSHTVSQCARAIEYSPDGNHLAIGTNEGHLLIFDAQTLTEITDVDLNRYGKRKIKNQTENWIQTLKYAPNGTILAVGTHAMVICLLSVNGNSYSVKGQLKAHNSAITHLDFSANSKYIQSNCLGYELLFHNVIESKLSKSKQNTSPKALRDVEWATQTCILGWGVQGIFDPDMDGTDVNCVDVSSNRKLIVTGDDFGQVNLWRYPAAETGNERVITRGHASHVTAARFSPNSKHVITAGGNDKVILQWKIV